MKATTEAERIWPPSDSPNRYDRRAEMVDQLCKKEISAANWQPMSLDRGRQMQEDAELVEAKKAFASLFATLL